VFFLAYGLHWAYDDILNLETSERRAYVRLLAEQIERENRAVEQASRRART
jgi:hypothetical protein